jgi:hypothetical protein
VHQAGFVTGIALLVGLAFVTDWTIRLVVVNAKLSGRDSYIEVSTRCHFWLDETVGGCIAGLLGVSCVIPMRDRKRRLAAHPVILDGSRCTESRW